MRYIYPAMKKYILPFRDLVVSPGVTVPVLIDNPMSVNCIKAAANAGSQQLVLVPQHSWAYPTSVKDIYAVGTIGDVLQVLSLPDGAIHAVVRTTHAVNLSDVQVNDGVFTADVTPIELQMDENAEQTIVLRDLVLENMQTLANMSRRFKMDKLRNVATNYPLSAFVDAVVQTADVDSSLSSGFCCALCCEGSRLSGASET